MGNFVHDVLETLYHLEPSYRTEDEAKVLAAQLWGNGWRDRVAPWVRDEEKLRIFRWKSWWCIQNLWKIEEPTLVAPIGLEHELNGEIGGVKIKGFIDRFDKNETGFTISDYKTGKTPAPRFREDKFFQLLIYSHLLESTGIGKATTVELLYLKDGVQFSQAVTQEDLEEVETTVILTKKQIDIKCETGKFEPYKSILCDWCSFKKVCPAWRS